MIDMQKSKKILFLLLMTSLLSPCFGANKGESDDHIRQIVAGMLREKDQKIEQLEARIRQLEDERQTGPATVVEHKQVENVPAASVTQQAIPATAAAVAEKATKSGDIQVTSKLKELSKKVDELKTAAEESGLLISGFFDVNAKTSNSSDQTFSVGSVELDLDYAHEGHFGASTALVFNGNNDPTISSGADFAVALVDYHLFDDRIPPRGRIFNNQGWHVQAGRFDLPFGTDYQYFASKDRVTVTAPLTTIRLQNGGYNSEGIRTYGSWKMINYSGFWTNGVYGGNGSTVGGRLGLSLSQNPYTVRHNSRDAIINGIEFGVSHLSELDPHNDIRSTVYGADLSIGYGMWRVQNEFMLLQGHQQAYLDADNHLVFVHTGIPIGKNHQLGYHSTLIADLENMIAHPVKVFARYSRWEPSQTLGLDFDATRIAMSDLSMLSLGLNYKFSNHLRVKLEYDDSLGTWIAERYFDKRLGIAQIVMSF